MKKSIIFAIASLVCVIFFSPDVFSFDTEEPSPPKVVYKNCLLKQSCQREFCNKELYTQGNSEVVKCGQIYRKKNKDRIILCHGCYRGSPYNPNICASDRNAHLMPNLCASDPKVDRVTKRYEGTVANFPTFLFESMGSDLREMLLMEREMFKKGFRAIYHVCNPGHYKYKDEGKKYVSPLFLYQLFGVLDSVGKEPDINSPGFIPCIPRYNNAAFEKVPNREAFIKLIQSSKKEDCDPDVRSVAFVAVAALGGCYHSEHGGTVYANYIFPTPMNGVPHPHKIIMNALSSSKIGLPEGEMKNVTDDLLKLANHFRVIDSALLQIFLSEDAFLTHVCYAKNAGRDIHPVDRKAIEDGKHLEPSVQLNVYLPTNLVTNREKCNIHLYTRCGEQKTPVPDDYLIKFRNDVLNTISKYKPQLKRLGS